MTGSSILAHSDGVWGPNNREHFVSHYNALLSSLIQGLLLLVQRTLSHSTKIGVKITTERYASAARDTLLRRQVRLYGEIRILQRRITALTDFFVVLNFPHAIIRAYSRFDDRSIHKYYASAARICSSLRIQVRFITREILL